MNHIFKVDFSNMPVGMSRFKFVLSYYRNILRTWWKFHYVFPWVKYKGFVRVMPGVTFAKFDIKIGNRVQFGKECQIDYNVYFGNNILLATRVCFIGKNDHRYDISGKYIWDNQGDRTGVTIVEDDVWLGFDVTVCGPVKIGKGSIVAAGAVVTKDIPPCEIWGGVPARKLRDRFKTEEEKKCHLKFLASSENG